MSHFKQEDKYGCGLYAISNIFHDETFITPKRLIESKNGNHIGQLNKWLIEHNKELYLEPFYFNMKGGKLPKWVCKIIPRDENVFSLPTLISFKHTKSSMTHMIAAEITNMGHLIVIDSLKDAEFFTTLDEFNKDNYCIFGIWYFRHYHEEGYLMRYNEKS